MFSCETCLLFTSTYFEQHLLSCAVWSICVVAYKYRNTKNKNLKLTFFSLPKNRKIGVCEEHFEESCFNKSVDLKRRLMKSKDYLCLISFLIYNIYWQRFSCSFVFWVKLLAIYFTENGLPRKLIDVSISTIFPHKEQKQERAQTFSY